MHARTDPAEAKARPPPDGALSRQTRSQVSHTSPALTRTAAGPTSEREGRHSDGKERDASRLFNSNTVRRRSSTRVALGVSTTGGALRWNQKKGGQGRGGGQGLGDRDGRQGTHSRGEKGNLGSGGQGEGEERGASGTKGGRTTRLTRRRGARREGLRARTWRRGREGARPGDAEPVWWLPHRANGAGLSRSSAARTPDALTETRAPTLSV